MKRHILIPIGIFLLLATVGVGTAVLGGGDQPPPEPVHVPEGRVGDRVMLATFEHEGDGAWQPTGSRSFEVEGVRRTLGPGGDGFDAVVVSVNQSNGAPILTTRGDGDHPQTTTYEHVDLDSRYVVWTDVKAAGDDIALGFPGIAVPRLEGLQYQGVDLEPGADLLHLARVDDGFVQHGGFLHAVDIPTPLPSGAQSFVSPFTFEFSFGRAEVLASRVAESGTVDGVEALGVRTLIRLDVNEEFGGGTLEVTRTDFFANGVPYPLATRSDYVVTAPTGERQTGGELVHLTGYVPGDGAPIGWRGEAGPRPAATAGAPARSADGRVHDGPTSTLPYKLDQAVVDAGLHVPFALWRVQNPDAVLGAAALGPAPDSTATAPGHRWELMFLTPEGDGFFVATERLVGSPAAEVSGGFTASRHEDVDVAQIPADPVLLSEVEAAWRLVAAPGSDTPADYVRWGLANDGGWSQGPVCPFATGSPPWAGDADANVFSLVTFGRTNAGQCLESADQQSTSALLYDIDRGVPLWSFEMRLDLDRPLGTAGSRPPELVAADTYTGEVPVLATGLIASGGLLLVAFLVYFLPVLKYALAKLGLALPGFSRIDKGAVLDHAVRDDLLRRITADPGVHAEALRKHAEVGWGTLVHHLTVLERNGFVSSLVAGRNRRFFPVGVMDWSSRDKVAALQHPKAKEAYDLVLARPDATTGELAAALGVTTAGAMWHLRRLEEAGLVRRFKVGRTVHHQAVRVDLAVHRIRAGHMAPAVASE